VPPRKLGLIVDDDSDVREALRVLGIDPRDF
jgi:hypothetical protein